MTVTELDVYCERLSVAVSVIVYVPEVGKVKVFPFCVTPDDVL